MTDKFIPHAPRNLPLPEGGRKAYIPRSVRGVELKTAPIPGAPKYQELPPSQSTVATDNGQRTTDNDLEATRIPFGPHKDKTLIQLLNDHPGYLAHLRDDAFTGHEEFEMAVEEFCLKYAHRLSRATGGSATSTLWVIAGHSTDANGTRHITASYVFAPDMTTAHHLAIEELQKRFAGHKDHGADVLNLPISDLRHALQMEGDHRKYGQRTTDK